MVRFSPCTLKNSNPKELPGKAGHFSKRKKAGIIFAGNCRFINRLLENCLNHKEEKLRRKTTIVLIASIFYSLFSFAQTPNFTAQTTSGCSPLVVNFQDQSTGNITSWFWDFGNGGTSTLQHPSATYFTPGTYTVKLTVTGTSGPKTTTKTNYITVYGKPTVNFKVSDSTGCYPLYAQFTDLSTPSAGTVNTSWVWDFGDGTQSTQQNPLHVYTASGNYTVSLKVTNDKGCTAVIPKISYIQISGGVESNFTSTQPTVCRPPFNISFTNSSTGPGTLTWTWDFGDGNNSNAQNPVHTYTSPGNYTVSLITTSSSGCIDTMTVSNMLNIQNINTAFTAPDSVCVNAPANMLNTSSPTPSSSIWDFGDGTTDNTIDAIKTFSTVGTYNIKLYNTYSYCSDSASKTIIVLPRPVAAFATNDTFKCQPSLTASFQDQSTNAVSWQWSFGDGGNSTQQNPTHTYSSFGSYDVQLIVTNASGCTDTLKKTNYVRITKPVISFAGLPARGCLPFTLSPVANIVTEDVVTSWSWNFGDGFFSNLPNPSHTYTVQGTYDLTLTITTSTGCTETYTLQGAIKVGRKPIVNFTAAPNPVCAFQNVQFTDLTNEADEWLWQFGDGSSSNQQNPLHQYSDTGLFHVVLIATNNGCADSLRINNLIRVKPPIADFTFQTNCNNRLQFNFIDSSIGATTWYWDFGDGTNSNVQNPVHFFPALGSYTVSLTVTNDTCSHTFSRLIKVIDESPDFTANFTSACKPSTFQFSAITADFSNIAQYLWDFGNGVQYTGVGIPGATASHYYTLSGYYTISVITTDIYGCKDTVVKNNYIRVNGPEADFSATNTSGCKGLTTTFNDLSTNDGISNIVSWKWDFGDGNVQTYSGGPFQHTYVNAGTYTVKLTVTDAGGCVDSIIKTNLIIATDPNPSFTADTLGCPGSTINFYNNSTGANITSVWYFGDGANSNLTAPSHQFADTGRYTIKLVITDQYGCKDSLIRNSYVKIARPVASYTVNDSISSCTPFEVHFTNTSDYYYTYVWNLSGGTSSVLHPVQFYTVPGVYQISLVVASPGGCLDTARSTITVYDTSGARVTYTPLDGCKPLTVSLTAYTPGPMDLYTWDFGDGILISDTSNTITHVYNFFGKFVPKVILTDPTGCIIPVSGIDTIRIKGATAKFGLDKQFFCDSGWVSFSDSTIYNDSLSLYNWDFGDGITSNLQNPTHQYTSPGLYTVTLNVQTEFACVDTFRIVEAVKVVESPLISIGGDSIICVNDFIDHLGLFQRPDSSVVQWSWQFPNGNTSNLQNPFPQQYLSAGNFTVNTIAVNSSGCRDSATKNILVHPLPTVSLPSTITKQAGFPVTIPATYTSNVMNWEWTPGETLDCPSCPQPIATPKFNTKYLVSFVDSNGCKNTGEVQIIVICKDANVFVPNTFSPNNDGSNDIFYVRGKGLERVKSLRIFNRWGEIVFEQQNFPVNNPGYGWNGTYKGNKPVPDVYVYQVEVFCENSQVIRFEGNIALIQ